MKMVASQSRSRSAFFQLISPESAVFWAWAVGLVMFAVASAYQGQMPYFQLLVSQEGLRDLSSPVSLIWIFAAYLAFFFGSKLVGRRVNWNVSVPAFDRREVIIGSFLFTSTVAFLWVGVAVVELGGLFQMAALAASENQLAREKILTAAFPGGRLVSSGFIALSVVSAAQISAEAKRPGRQKILGLSIVLFGSLAYLAIIPILTSGRINFFVAALGAYVAASICAGRPVSMRFALIGAAALGASWTAKQYFTLGHISDASASQQGFEGMLFYFYNDMLNALNPVENMGAHATLGWYSARFFFYITFTTQLLRGAVADDLAHIGTWMSAGEVPLLTAPFVDFGFLGLVWLIVIGYFSRYLFVRAFQGVGQSSLYGICFATLLISVHNSYLTSQEIFYNLIFLVVLTKLAKAPAGRR